MQDLKVTLVQSDLYWQSITANLAMFEEQLWSIDGDTDLVLLPEMFSTGFSMDAERLAEPMNFTTFRWMKQMAEQVQAVVAGSFIVKEEQKYYNRLVWMNPNGTYDMYDKKHLFTLAKEHECFEPGQERLISTVKGWKVCPMICYDLRFPVWARNGYDEAKQCMEYDLLCYIASWPSFRINAWDILLKGRAVENMAYTIGVNRIGEDGNDIPYNGHSAAIGPKGDTIFFADDKSTVTTVTLKADDLMQYRGKYPFYKDADAFSLG